MTTTPALSTPVYTELSRFCTKLTDMWDEVSIHVDAAKKSALVANTIKQDDMYPIQKMLGAFLAENVAPDFSGYIPEYNTFVRVSKHHRSPVAEYESGVMDDDPMLTDEWPEKDEDGPFFYFANFTICHTLLEPPA